jgi:hypothetical protein
LQCGDLVDNDGTNDDTDVYRCSIIGIEYLDRFLVYSATLALLSFSQKRAISPNSTRKSTHPFFDVLYQRPTLPILLQQTMSKASPTASSDDITQPPHSQMTLLLHLARCIVPDKLDTSHPSRFGLQFLQKKEANCGRQANPRVRRGKVWIFYRSIREVRSRGGRGEIDNCCCLLGFEGGTL